MKIVYWTVISLLLFCPPVLAASKAREVKQGKKLFEQGKYEEALEKFARALEKDPNSDIINFDTGIALYKLQDYGKAIRHLRQALLSDDRTLRQKTHYNLGNSFYQQGMIKAATDLAMAVEFLKQSVDHFDKALVMNKKDEDAQFNRELAAKELKLLEEELEKQKKEQQKNNQTCPFPKKEESQGQSQSSQQQEQNRPDAGEDQEKGNKEDQAQGQEQKSGEEKKDGEERNDAGKKAEEDTEGQSAGTQDQESSSREGEGGQAVSDEKSEAREDAMILLEKYQQEEPKGFLQRLLRRQAGEREVEKDW
ncbi:MAG TPA: hypothetical protein DD723_09915 [Candidatus Omnitrophica bacterium]|nr:MAG: hypothetical protein A2Z81_06215 [Omnitrophica WOR_2 bacterium GWA2_45_18]HBR15833.1 hypothetical protein [Candidatus Omnitrophota bacterium]